MAQKTKLHEEIELKTPDGTKHIFKTVEELVKWANHEISTWQDVQSQLNLGLPFNHGDLLEALIIDPQNIRNYAEGYRTATDANQRQQYWDNIRAHFLKYSQDKHGRPVVSSSPAGIEILKTVVENPDAAVIMLARAQAMQVHTSNIPDNVRFVDACFAANNAGINVKTAAAIQKRSLQILADDWSDRFSDQFADIDDEIAKNVLKRKQSISLAGRLLRRYGHLQRSHEAKLAAMQAAFSTDMKLRAAEKYWGRKRRAHERAARSGLNRFISWTTGLVVALFLFYLAAYGFLRDTMGVKEAFTTAEIFAYGVPTVLALWALRILAAIYRDNRNLADDAAERVAMVFTFKALEYEGRVSDEERLVILSALFRPHERGPEDAMPHAAWEAILKRINPRN